MTNKLPTFYQALGVTENQLINVITNKSKFYISYPIRKKSGKPRYIDAPLGTLKTLQNALLRSILYKFSASSIAHGFVKDRSPITNAKQHVGARLVIKVDIENFFNNITQDHVFKAFKTFLFRAQKPICFSNEDVELHYLSELLTYKTRVPQGAPTSPPLTNLLCLGLDKDLRKLQTKFNCTVTRYADDITVSTHDNLDIGKVISYLYSILKRHGFKMNWNKTRICRQSSCMSVTGVVINRKINIKRKKYRRLRACLHQLISNGITITKDEYERLRGKIEWVKSLNSKKGLFLTNQLSKVSIAEHLN